MVDGGLGERMKGSGDVQEEHEVKGGDSGINLGCIMKLVTHGRRGKINEEKIRR